MGTKSVNMGLSEKTLERIANLQHRLHAPSTAAPRCRSLFTVTSRGVSMLTGILVIGATVVGLGTGAYLVARRFNPTRQRARHRIWPGIDNDDTTRDESFWKQEYLADSVTGS